ncbi:GSU2403 family nucleotidyltransferase fold protein [Rhodoferax sp.]|uniref:GSU2403 family nucleotidyltransferase fold protein n=1 Tax=Rhodoferax sp. TaxID=50421 RepID=UPI00275C414C|nr:nucleotidyltransferase domain-containing protein [Rhodoferax sp.]
MTLYQEFSLAAQTAFAGVDSAARDADLQRSVADLPGGFAKKVVSGRTYWYYQVKSPNGKLRQSYVGPDDESTRALIQRHADPVAKLARQQLARMARAAMELGCADIPPKHARVIERLADSGLFSAGGILVGTHAFLAYQNVFGVRWSAGAATLDLDFAHAGRNVSLALPENLTLDTPAAIESLQMGFIPNLARTSFRKADEPDFDLDFLTSRGRRGDEPVTVPRLNLTLQPLRFMELSLQDPMRVTLLARSGPIVVNLPRPQRYALHKLLVYGERPQAQRVKARKDVAQAAALIDYLLVHDSAEMAAMWVDVNARGPGWRKRLKEGFEVMASLYPGCDFAERIRRATAY